MKMNRIIKVNDYLYFRFFSEDDGIPMIWISNMGGRESRHIVLTCDEMNKLVKEYLAQKML